MLNSIMMSNAPLRPIFIFAISKQILPACLPHNILFRLTKKGEIIKCFRTRTSSAYHSSINLSSNLCIPFLLIQGKFCVFPLFAGLLRSLKTFYLSRLCSTGGSLLQPNGPFPCDLELFRQITQKQIREILARRQTIKNFKGKFCS